jgi:hypothetical protein
VVLLVACLCSICKERTHPLFRQAYPLELTRLFGALALTSCQGSGIWTPWQSLASKIARIFGICSRAEGLL